MSKDPSLWWGGQANLYVYVGSDPVNYIDLTGRGKTSLVARIVDLTERGFKYVKGRLGYDDALQAAKDGEDLLAKNKRTARELANEAGAGQCVHHDPHPSAGPDAKPHYHPTPGAPNHIFYDILDALGPLFPQVPYDMARPNVGVN